MQRRNLFKLGLASAAVLLAVGGASTLLQPGFKNQALTGNGREVFKAVASAVLDKTLPEANPARKVALDGLMTRIDSLVGALPLHTQNELSQLLSLLASVPGRYALAGLQSSWTEASVAEVQLALEGMRWSSLALRQQAYAALHDIAAGAYFSDPSSWPLLGYPGPLNI